MRNTQGGLRCGCPHCKRSPFVRDQSLVIDGYIRAAMAESEHKECELVSTLAGVASSGRRTFVTLKYVSHTWTNSLSCEMH